MAQEFDIRAALGLPPKGNAAASETVSFDYKAVDSFDAKKLRTPDFDPLVKPFDIREAVMQPPRLQGAARAKQDVRSAVLGLGSGIAGTVAAGARALLGAADVPVPITGGPGKLKQEATQRVYEGTMAPFEAVAPGAPTQPYTPRRFEEGFAGAAGSSITFLGPGAAARMAGVGMKGLMGLTGSLGASQSFGQRYVDATKAGATEDQAFTAALISAAGGATEAFGGEALALGRMFGVANKATKGALAVILESGIENAGQEAVQGVIDNLGEQIYNGDRKLLDGVLEAAAIGGTIGTLFGSAAAVAQRMRSGATAQAQPTARPQQAQAEPTSPAPQIVAPGSVQPETAGLSPQSIAHMEVIRRDPKMKAMPEAASIQEVKPVIPEHQWAQEWLNQRGTKAVFVQDQAGKPLPFRGVKIDDTVYLDASLPPTEIKRKVVYHEAVHLLDEQARNGLLESWRATDPKGYAAAEQEVARRYPAAQTPEEATAHNAEAIWEWIAAGEISPGRLKAIIDHNPNVWVRFVDAVKRAARALGMDLGQTTFEQLTSGLSADNPQHTARIAQAYVTAFENMLSRPTVQQQFVSSPQAATPVVESQQATGVTQEPRFATAFHGSPYDFDRFSTEKIGTGEGAQAYGWGLYFAGKKEIAEHYKNALSPGRGNQPIDEAARLINEHGRDKALEIARARVEGPHETVTIGKDLSVTRAPNPDAKARAQAIVDAIESGRAQGRLYQVDLAPAEDEYLLWDKPLSEQSEKVKAGLASLPVYADFKTYLAKQHGQFERTGENFHDFLEQTGLTRREAAQALRSSGIRGIKYLDASSRSDGEGSYNYVIFDDADVRVEAKFALADDARGDAHFDIPDYTLVDKLIATTANTEHYIETTERALGLKPHEGVTYAADTSRGKANQDVAKVQRSFLMPILKHAAKATIPFDQSTLGDNGKVSLGDFMRYLAAQQRNAFLAGGEHTDPVTGKKIKFGIEERPASGTDSLGQPITNSYAAARLEKALKGPDGAQYRAIAELVRNGNEWKLQRLVDSGVQSNEWRDNVKAAYGEYWSSFADAEQHSKGVVPKTFQVSGAQYSSAKGRLNTGGNPFELWMSDLAQVISRTRRNEVGRTFGAMLEKYKELGRVIPYGQTRKGLQKRLAEINTELDLLTKDDPAGSRLRIERGEIMAELANPTIEERQNKQTFKWRENGQDVTAIVHNRVLADALKGMDADMIPGFLRWINSYSRLFRKLATGYNPEFAFGNAPRDVGYAWSKLYLNYDTRTANRMVKRLKPAAKALAQIQLGKPATPDTEAYHLWHNEALANGADVSRAEWGEIEKEIGSLIEGATASEKAERFIQIQTPQHIQRVAALVENFNKVVETMTRLAVYSELRASGRSVEESVSAWRRTSIDWAKSGTPGTTAWLSFVGAFVPSALKGTNDFYQTIRTAPKKRLATLAGALFAVGYLNSLLSQHLSDEWDDESEWSKARRMFVKVGKWSVGLPLLWGFNLFYYGGVLAGDVLHGDKSAGDATIDMATAVMDTMDPLGIPPASSTTRRGAMDYGKAMVAGAAPQVVKPIAEAAVNKTFTGGPVYPDFPNVPAHQQAWPDTANAAKWFAMFLNRAGGGTTSVEAEGPWSISPAAMEHIVSGYFPGVGKLLEDSYFTAEKIVTGDVAGIEVNRFPFVRKFVRTTPSSAPAKRYATASRLIDDAVGRMKDYEPRPGDETMVGFEEAKRRIDNYLSQKRRELEIATDPKHKRAIEDEINWVKDQLSSRVKQEARAKR